MAKIQYELRKAVPSVNAGYSGNPFDPGKLYINKALGSYGAIPPYFLTAKHRFGAIEGIDPDHELDQEKLRQEFRAYGQIQSVMPMKMKRASDSEWFTFPIEPLVTINGKNKIIRRNVAKSTAKGTVKERWSQDDYEITIQGVLTDEDDDRYPQEDLQRLLDLFDERQAVEVAQDILWIFGIKHLAIETANFPHTSGLNNQNYEIKAYSDNPIELLIPL